MDTLSGRRSFVGSSGKTLASTPDDGAECVVRRGGRRRPLVRPGPWQRQGESLDEFPNVKRWFEMIAQRPAATRAYARVDEVNPDTDAPQSEEDRRILFGQTATWIDAAQPG
jgi:hypothetical protein